MMTMEAKHWFGLVAAGAALLGAGFAFNNPVKPWEVDGARAPVAGISALADGNGGEAPAAGRPAAPAPKPATPAVPRPTAPSAAREPESRPSSAPASKPAAGAPVAASGELSRDWKGAMIAGTVKWDDRPQRERVQSVDSDPVCKALNPEPLMTENYVVDENGNLGNVIVYVDKVPSGDYAVREETVVIDQVGCRYVPHVIAIQVGQKVLLRNSDATTHNVHFKSRLNGDWNMTQTSKGDLPPMREFARAEIGTPLLKCDIHPWMEARLGIFDHPFFSVTRESGTFAIPQGLPDGKYTVTAWHARAKTATAEVNVVKGKTSEVNFVFSRNKNTAAVVAEGK